MLTKDPCKTIMKRSTLKRKVSRTKQQECITKYKKQLNVIEKQNIGSLLGINGDHIFLIKRAKVILN